MRKITTVSLAILAFYSSLSFALVQTAPIPSANLGEKSTQQIIEKSTAEKTDWDLEIIKYARETLRRTKKSNKILHSDKRYTKYVQTLMMALEAYEKCSVEQKQNFKSGFGTQVDLEILEMVEIGLKRENYTADGILIQDIIQAGGCSNYHYCAKAGGYDACRYAKNKGCAWISNYRCQTRSGGC